MVHDHRIGVAGHDGIDHAQRLGFGVVAERLGEPDRACCLAERFEATVHGGQLDIRRIDHDDLPDVLAAILDAQPVAIQCVKRVLAAPGAEHPVDRVAPRIADAVPAVGITEAPGLSLADPTLSAHT